MALHPEIAAIVNAVNSTPTVDPRSVLVESRRDNYREMALGLWPNPPEMAQVRDVQLSLEGRSLSARLCPRQTAASSRLLPQVFISPMTSLLCPHQASRWWLTRTIIVSV